MKTWVSRIFAGLLSGLFLAGPVPSAAAADWNVDIHLGHGHYGKKYSKFHKRHSKHYYHHYDRPFRRYPYHTRRPARDHFTKVDYHLPFGAVSLIVDGRKYHFHDGIFYTYSGHYYIPTSAPIGARISRLPWGSEKKLVNGKYYYLNNGVHYRRVPFGYEVVPPPREIIVKHVTDSSGRVLTSGQDSYTINIPTGTGGYAAVTIRRQGDGYVGPQGEFYGDFPSVDQLQVMYGT